VEHASWQAHRTSFGPAADLYDRVRPRYPVEAIQWALAPLGNGAHDVVDMGAGTGILTRQLVALGQRVLAIEPDEKMRARLAATTPTATVAAGSAEDMPVPDGSVDAVLAGQAYHWFEPERAHREIARVVRPGGVFAPIWNDRDESEPWVMEFTRILEGRRWDTAEREITDFGPGFGPVRIASFRHHTMQTTDGLVDLLRSRSYYLTAAPDERAQLEADVRQLAATHPALAGRDRFPLPYVTNVYRAVRTGSAGTPSGARSA
jgi:SAM-dependent methyltransferase